MKHHIATHHRHGAKPSPLVRFLEHPHGPDLGGLVHAFERVALGVGLTAAAVAATAGAVMLLRIVRRTRGGQKGTLYRLRLPEEFDRAQLAQMLSGVAGSLRRGFFSRPYLGFELHAAGRRLEPLVFASAGLSQSVVEDLIGEAIPGAQLTPLGEAKTHGTAELRPAATSLVLSEPEQLPIRTEFKADPAGLILRSLAGAGKEGHAVAQVLFAPAPGRVRRRMRGDAARFRTGRRRQPPILLGLNFALSVVLAAANAVFELFDRGPSPKASGAAPAFEVGQWDRRRADALDRKASESLFVCSLRMATWMPTRGLARARLADLVSAYGQFGGDGELHRGFEFRRLAWMQRRLMPFRTRLVLSAPELAALCPFPQRPADGVVPFEQPPARELLPSAEAPRSGIALGTSGAHGHHEPVYVTVDGLLHHAHLIGATGAGKSTTLLNLGTQLMQQGHGLVVVEPKGDLIDDLLASVPRERASEVVLLDFGDPAFPPAFNLLAGGRGQGEALAGIFSRLFGSNWGPRSDDLLRAAVLTLEGGDRTGEVPTLADVLPLLQDPRRRARYAVKDTVVLQGFWQSWERFSEGQRQQALAPLSNKLRAFLLREPVRDALVQPEAPDFRSIINEGKILLCSLSAESLGEEGASLFGSVLLHRLWQAALSLGPARGRQPLICLVDEAHRFTALPGGINEVLAQARGYGLGFVLAHQDLSQLSAELRQAMAANCRTKLTFQLDPPDNERMAKHFEPRLTAPDLLHLDRFQLAARVFDRGLSLPPATAVAPGPPEIDTVGIAGMVRMHNHIGARTVDEVAELIAKRFPELEHPPRGEVAPDVDRPPAGTHGGTPDVPPNVPPGRDNSASSGASGNSDDEDEEDLWHAV